MKTNTTTAHSTPAKTVHYLDPLADEAYVTLCGISHPSAARTSGPATGPVTCKRCAARLEQQPMLAYFTHPDLTGADKKDPEGDHFFGLFSDYYDDKGQYRGSRYPYRKTAV